MDFMPEWKSLWPISSTFSAPLLIPNKKQETPFGPLIFTPSPESSTRLLQSPSLSPCLPPPYPPLSVSRFLQNYNSVLSSSSISSLLGHQLPDHSSYVHGFNSLQLLQIPNKKLIVAFFPTGENSDCVGFSLLSVQGGVLSVHSQMESFFHVVKEGNVNRQRITLLLVNSVDDFCGDENGDDTKSKIVTVGFVMVCTRYSVCWYRVGITSVYRQNEYSVCLDCLGCANTKVFRGNAVASACWSPHLREECLVLLENGDLLLFDVNSSFKGMVKSIFSVSGNNGAVNRRMHVSLTDKLGLEKKEIRWFKCEFSWRPGIIIASHRTEIFLVDLSSQGECKAWTLLKLEMLSKNKNDGFFAVSRVVSDEFFFTVATKYLLLLCDVRKPLMPVLRWAHGIQNPLYMTVFKLSDLRANAESTEYKLASESGYCIMLGSFWDNEFSYFCYGRDCNVNESISSKISKSCNLYYAWGLPLELPLSDSTCNCGNCLVKEEFTNMSLPVWIDWRQKKHLVLGFGILEAGLYAHVSTHNIDGGFILIRLTSSGKLEAQHYYATWEPEKFPEAGHKRKSAYLYDNLLFDCNHSEYDGVKKFQHLKLEFLDTFLKGKLEKYIVKRREKIEDEIEDGHQGASQKRRLVKSESSFHEEICHKLKAFGLPEVKSSSGVSNVLKDINLPTSVHEIALRAMFLSLPTNLMQFAFATYSDFEEDHETHNEPLEFLNIPDQLQAPPFPFRKPSYRSSRWSSKVQPSNALVGPILPTLFLNSLHKLCMEELKDKRELYLEESEAFSTHAQLKLQCDKVMKDVQEHISGPDDKNRDDEFISLADDTERMSSDSTQKLKLSCHKPSAFLENPTTMDLSIFSTHVFRKSELLASDISSGMVGKEIFDVGCPIELKFDDRAIDLGPKELETFQNMKKRDLVFQRSFKPYQDYIRRDGY